MKEESLFEKKEEKKKVSLLFRVLSFKHKNPSSPFLCAF